MVNKTFDMLQLCSNILGNHSEGYTRRLTLIKLQSNRLYAAESYSTSDRKSRHIAAALILQFVVLPAAYNIISNNNFNGSYRIALVGAGTIGDNSGPSANAFSGNNVKQPATGCLDSIKTAELLNNKLVNDNC